MKALLFVAIALLPFAVHAQTDTLYAQYPTYAGKDLGLTYQNTKAYIRVWAPTAGALELKVYANGEGGAATQTLAMQKDAGGTWVLALPNSTAGFYTLQATIAGKQMAEVTDPYAHAVGINGRRAAFTDPALIELPGWELSKRPVLKSFNDIILGELHVRDLSTNPNSGISYPGKYLGVAQTGTKGPAGVSTGQAHLLELGITHLHLLPTNDFNSINEQPGQKGPTFNWGYDPLNYTVPEGSFATDATNPVTRLKEFKQMVYSLHRSGLRVVLDVVYNHVADAGSSNFEQLVPGYYFRHWADGRYSDASGCGNEIASDRPMVRKLIVESVAYWARVYMIDGFRFDLMGILDLETMRQVRTTLDAIDPTIYVYGEGWTAGSSPYPEKLRALKANTGQLTGVAAFGDELRDGVKGHFSRHDETGFAGGRPGCEESVKFGIVAATQHPQVVYSKVNASKAPWATSPAQCINYVACHDDMVLWDKIVASTPGFTEAERVKVDILSNTIVFTAQGVPFLPIGDEFLRTKKGISNSYNKPDSINQLDYTYKANNLSVFNYYKKLVAMRKAHPAFKLSTAEAIRTHLEFLPSPAGTIAYTLKNNAGGDTWQNIVVVFNGSRASANVAVPAGTYKVVLRGAELDEAGLGTHTGPTLDVPAATAVILVTK